MGNQTYVTSAHLGSVPTLRFIFLFAQWLYFILNNEMTQVALVYFYIRSFGTHYFPKRQNSIRAENNTQHTKIIKLCNARQPECECDSAAQWVGGMNFRSPRPITDVCYLISIGQTINQDTKCLNSIQIRSERQIVQQQIQATDSLEPFRQL